MEVLKINYIYCYTNKQNGKKYVGQTNNIKRRYKQHKDDSFANYSDARYNQAIHCAIRKYGLDNFDFEILEVLENKTSEEVNERETYWIREKNSLAPNGYNLKATGEANRGRNSSSLSDADKNEIRRRLREKESIREIAEDYLLSYSYVSQINTGERLFSDNENYPLQSNRTEVYLYLKIIELLKDTMLSMNKIAETLGVSKDTVQRVNRGQQAAVKNLYDDFPIRKQKQGSYRINL